MLVLDKTLSEIADIVQGRIRGDGRVRIKGLSSVKEAKEGDLTFLANSKYLALAQDTKASAVFVNSDVNLSHKPIIVVDNPSLAFAQIINKVLDVKKFQPKGIHPSAIVAADAQLGANVALGANVVVEAQVVIGDNTIIEPGTFIGHETHIGEACHIYPNVTIRERSQIARRVIIHSGSVIGADGFGFELVDELIFIY